MEKNEVYKREKKDTSSKLVAVDVMYASERQISYQLC